MVKMRTFESESQLIDTVAELLRETLPKPGTLMLSGGSTPYAAYSRIAAAPGPVHPERDLFLSDERMVPADSPNSNQGKLMPMLQALQCRDRFIAVDTALPAAEAAERFAARLDNVKEIDVGLLGMGTDGHTAGFFTPDQARMTAGPLTLYTLRPDGMTGVSVTPALLRRVKRILLLVSGEAKRSIVSTLLHAPDTIPAGIALKDHPRAELWTDL